MGHPDCPHCGRPMERVDDFWFCDNEECPRRTLRYPSLPARPAPARKEPVEGGATGGSVLPPKRRAR